MVIAIQIIITIYFVYGGNLNHTPRKEEKKKRRKEETHINRPVTNSMPQVIRHLRQTSHCHWRILREGKNSKSLRPGLDEWFKKPESHFQSPVNLFMTPHPTLIIHGHNHYHVPSPKKRKGKERKTEKGGLTRCVHPY
jgi:hypothetical protein